MSGTKPICVLGILDTPRGVEIATVMERWLCRIYEVHECLHDGTRFELPALLLAQEVALDAGEPVLYLHTRGAVNTYSTTAWTHRMWRREFGEQWLKYQLLASCGQPSVFAPFVDKNGTHRYNGFIANAEAWERADLQPTAERHEYEHIWRGVPGVQTIGTIIHSEQNMIKDIRAYLRKNYG